MNTNLADQLFERYPLIFPDRDGRRNILGNIDGWFDLIDDLCAALQSAADNGSPQPVATQVKVKFGELRFYAQGVDRYQASLIARAETASGRLCWVCGHSVGESDQPGRCVEHAKPDAP